MINDLMIERTYSTPKVNFGLKSGMLRIEGRSIPENPSAFYEPLTEWIREYFIHPALKTKLEIKLDYINSGSSKSILTILKFVREYTKRGYDIEVNWYYEEDDESIRDLGKHYKSLLKMPFNLVETYS